MSRIILIAGMHRSGTSMMASCLQDCGIAMGSQLVSENERNPRGFFEDIDLLAFHESLLAHRGIPVLLQEDFKFVPSPEETALAEKIVLTRNHSPRWGWKEPRTTLFLDFWAKLLPDFKILLLYRHPVDVWFSLIRAGDSGRLSFRAGLNSWRIYNQRALEFGRRHPNQVLTVSIDTVLERSDEFAERAGEFFQINPRDLHTALNRRFVRNDFRQSVVGQALADWCEKLDSSAASVLSELDEQSMCSRPASAATIPHLKDFLQHTCWVEATLAETRAIVVSHERWARTAEARLTAEAKLAEQNRLWAEQSDNKLKTAAELATTHRTWAENAEKKIVELNELAETNRRWAEQAEAKLKAEAEMAKRHRQWAETAEQRIAEATKLAEQNRLWAERTEMNLEAARRESLSNRRWAEQSEAALKVAKEEAVANRRWAEQTEALLAEARLIAEQK